MNTNDQQISLTKLRREILLNEGHSPPKQNSSSKKLRASGVNLGLDPTLKEFHYSLTNQENPKISSKIGSRSNTQIKKNNQKGATSIDKSSSYSRTHTINTNTESKSRFSMKNKFNSTKTENGGNRKSTCLEGALIEALMEEDEYSSEDALENESKLSSRTDLDEQESDLHLSPFANNNKGKVVNRILNSKFIREINAKQFDLRVGAFELVKSKKKMTTTS